ncbi:antibiotic biosynthesis monooxygenase [Actinoplanes ianthinogenes]|uniref:Antibiotic biosynthesis monooxygenase n=1 Tax=Actinoplanes ianthinogenes TaxID=122358 RepID=A0ABN6CNS8_9ACTN|nr:antibiotic biosynthesis monooxygenase family protein [Actinoplanes ianthinogenes]BCJ46883.1 antibiotic biosynthesis monooxygenase [Actinoplanes ianthinogenes]GGR14872.1 antibiotic biosynthesis monooxygenase [Actinoplanes ianthinogenes]
MIIVAGELRVAAEDRDRYLLAVADVARLARRAPGCHDFVQSADPIEPDRILVYERWSSDEALLTFRAADGPSLDLPAVVSADVRKYRISAVEAP